MKLKTNLQFWKGFFIGLICLLFIVIVGWIVISSDVYKNAVEKNYCGWNQTRGECIFKFFDVCKTNVDLNQCNKNPACLWKVACTSIDCGFDINGNDYYAQCLPRWWDNDADIEYVFTKGKGYKKGY